MFIFPLFLDTVMCANEFKTKEKTKNNCNNYTSGNRNIFALSLLKFVSKRLFSFTVNWSDYILALTPNVSR